MNYSWWRPFNCATMKKRKKTLFLALSLSIQWPGKNILQKNVALHLKSIWKFVTILRSHSLIHMNLSQYQHRVYCTLMEIDRKTKVFSIRWMYFGKSVLVLTLEVVGQINSSLRKHFGHVNRFSCEHSVKLYDKWQRTHTHTQKKDRERSERVWFVRYEILT